MVVRGFRKRICLPFYSSKDSCLTIRGRKNGSVYRLSYFNTTAGINKRRQAVRYKNKKLRIQFQYNRYISMQTNDQTRLLSLSKSKVSKFNFFFNMVFNDVQKQKCKLNITFL